MFARADPLDADFDPASHDITTGTDTVPSVEPHPVDPAADLARCFCGLPICPTSRSTGSAGMKLSFGVKSAKSCLPSTHWTGANRKIEGAVFVSEGGKHCRLKHATTIELRGPPICAIDAELGWDGPAIGVNRG